MAHKVACGSTSVRRRGNAPVAGASRRLLRETARRKQRERDGGGRARRDVTEVDPPAPEPREDLLALDEALTRLAEEDRQAADLVQLRYFAGLTLAEAAEAL